MRRPTLNYWICTVLSFAFSAGLPVVAIGQKFPIWNQTVSPAYTIGVGGVLTIIVCLVVFRKTLVPALMAKLGITSIPPVVIWVSALIVAEIVAKINTFMTDIKAVIFAGLAGAAFGWAFSLAAAYFNKKSKEQ